MKIRELYNHFCHSLTSIYTHGEAVAIADKIFEEFAGISKRTLIIDVENSFSEETANQLKLMLEQLMQSIPVQYVLGSVQFCGYSFKVNQNVLIPRPETEELVYSALEDARTHAIVSLLDIGTGSGCIAISCKKALPNVHIEAADVSKTALQVAAMNARALNEAILFHEMDILNSASWNKLSSYNMIISNPPYIPISEKDTLDPNVRLHEPSLALFVPDEDPLIFYKAICNLGKTHLTENGIIWLEIHEQYGQETLALYELAGYACTLISDENGKDRFIRATIRCR